MEYPVLYARCVLSPLLMITIINMLMLVNWIVLHIWEPYWYPFSQYRPTCSEIWHQVTNVKHAPHYVLNLYHVLYAQCVLSPLLIISANVFWDLTTCY
jgi:hypothetical protein